MVPRGIGLSGCGRKYATACSNPFDQDADFSCVPAFPTRESQKVTGFFETTAFIGSSGYGFVALAPSLANNATMLWKSTATYGQNTYKVDSALEAGGQISSDGCPNLPYTQAQLTSSGAGDVKVVGRIVSAGLEASYSGTLLDRGGNYYVYSSPNHNNTLPTQNSELTSRQQCLVTTIGEKPVMTAVSAIDSDEVDFTGSPSLSDIQNLYPYSQDQYVHSNYTGIGAPVCIIAFVGKAESPIRVRVRLHCEYAGELAQTNLSPSHSNVIDFNAIQQAKSQMMAQRSDGKIVNQKSTMFELADKILNHPATQNVVKYAAGAAMKYATSSSGNLVELR